MTGPREITLDVRDLEPPEPYERATEALRKLEANQYIRMVSRRRPRLLYPWLSERGFREQTRQLDEEHYEIFIWAAGDEAVARHISGII